MTNALLVLLSLTASGSLLALLLFAAKPLLKSRVSQAFLYYIWLLVLLRLVVPVAAPVNVIGALPGGSTPDVSSSMAAGETGAPAEAGTGGAGVQADVSSNTQAAPREPQNTETSGAVFSPGTHLSVIWRVIETHLLWIWLAGAAVSLGWYVTSYACYSRRIKHSYMAPHADDLAVFERMRGNKKVKMTCSSNVTTPMLIGVLSPVIVLPQLAYVQNGKSRELAHIFWHELTHLRRKDVIYKWFVIAVTSLHWFNPLMPLIRKEINRACELSCDESVIGDMSAEDKRHYGNTLLALSANRKLPTGILATTLSEGKEELKERLIGILNYKKKPAWALALTLTLSVLLTGCAAVLGVPKSAVSTVASENSALRTALTHYTTAGEGDIAAPLQSVSGDLLKTCNFPVALPAYLPSPGSGKEWSVSPEIKSGTFSLELYELPLGDTSPARSNSEWYGLVAGNAGVPAPLPTENQFRDGQSQTRDISLPDGITGTEYVNAPDAAGGTAITWKAGNWSFFVSAYPENTSDSTKSYAAKIIRAIKDSGQPLPGLQGQLSFSYTSNMPMTKLSWEVKKGIWYEIDMREPDVAIKILQSFKTLEPAGTDQPGTTPDGSSPAAAIPLDTLKPYVAPAVETAVLNSSDISEVITSYPLDGGAKIILYKTESGLRAFACRAADGKLVRFYEAGGYETGYDVKPYNNVFGHNGFYIESPVGAAYTAINYYYFDPDGTLKLLIECDNYTIESDMNGDGNKELLYFYHGVPTDAAGAWQAYYCFERNGKIYIADLAEQLGHEFPEAQNSDDPGRFYTSAGDGSVLFFAYHLKGETRDTHKLELKFTENSLLVYSAESQTKTGTV